jgi:poly-gamma-glutamate capsule biosynthesis protein CapA/YwtB (metallophosphatase superfamily)/outer membrane protein assembly factor BamB
MKHPARLLLPVLLAVFWGLSSCGPAPVSPVVPVPSATSPGTATPAPAPSLAPSHTSRPSPAPSVAPTSTAIPATDLPFTPTPAASPTPTLPLIQVPAPGDPLALSLRWQFDTNGHLTDSGVLPRGGRPLFLLASLGRIVYAVTESGQLAWRGRMSGPVYTVAGLDGDRVAAGDDAGAVTVFSAGGQPLWESHLDSRVTALHGGWQGGLLAGGWDQRLHFLNGEDGAPLWQAELGGPLSSIDVLPDLVVAATLDGEVLAFSATGTQMWRSSAGAPVTRLEVMGEGVSAQVLVGTQDGRLLALDPEGALRWQLDLGPGGPVWDFADLAGDPAPEIVVGTAVTEPFLAMLSANGEILWRVAVPAPVNAITSTDLDGDRAREVVAGLASGEVQAYDPQGRLRGTVHAGLAVWGLEGLEDGSALILADVVAWKLVGSPGSVGSPWLVPPVMVQLPSDPITAETARDSTEAILVFLGDVVPGRSMEAQLARYGPAYAWQGLDPLLAEADLAVANLECVLTTQGKPLGKPYVIRAHPRWGETLTEAGFDLVTLANNHALDYGPPGLEETLSTVQTLHIGVVGAGSSREAAHSPALFALKGIRVAVLGYAAARWNGSADVPATDRLAWAEPAAVQADVRAVRDQADLVVVLLHAGTEYAAKPSSGQVAVAHAAIDAGADLVVGHHPHVTQSVERYGDGLIVYSLGDALFDIPRQAAMQGELLRVHVTREGLAQAELWPFWIEDAIRPRLLDDGRGRARFKIIYP